MAVIRGANLALKFIIELAAYAAFAYWGAATGPMAVSILLAIATPAVVIGLWAVFAAPKSERRLPTAQRIPFELAVFALAVIAAYFAIDPVAGTILAVLVVVNAMLLTLLDQWES